MRPVVFIDTSDPNCRIGIAGNLPHWNHIQQLWTELMVDDRSLWPENLMRQPTTNRRPTAANNIPKKTEALPPTKGLRLVENPSSAAASQNTTIFPRQPMRQIRKLAARISPKLRRPMPRGFPSTSSQRPAPVPVIPERKDPVNDSIASHTCAPYIEVKEEVHPDNSLRLCGHYWEVMYAGTTSILEDTRGLRYIAFLIRQAGQGPTYAGELVAFATGNPSEVVELQSREPVMDSVAENRLIQRLENIGFERNSALAQNNYERVAALDDEVDRITEELQRARSPRKGRGTAAFNSSAEKARKAVSKAISETISKMLGYPDLQPLASHLSATIQKGQWLSYNSEIQWDVQFQMPASGKSRPKNAPSATRKVASAKAGSSK